MRQHTQRVSTMTPTRAIPTDYDIDPNRFRANVRAVEQYGLANDVHDEVAQRIAAEGLGPALDLGCGEGRLSKPLFSLNVQTISLDASATMLAAMSGLRVQADACRLPFRDQSFGSVAALYMLYHLEDPRLALAECLRVLRPGGLFAACAPSRFNDPELADVLPPSEPATFDAENGEAFGCWILRRHRSGTVGRTASLPAGPRCAVGLLAGPPTDALEHRSRS